jgi:predicted small lipoprotein YifL
MASSYRLLPLQFVTTMEINMKTTFKLKTSIILLALTALVACDEKAPPPSASFSTVEEQRAQGRSNAGAAAAEYQKQNPRLQGWESIVKADTTHSAACPQGDGWAEVVFMRTERTEGSTKNLQIEKATTMCSTVSTVQGCVMVSPADNWSKHPGKAQDGSCASTSEVPMPLPKVVGAK